MATGTAVLNLGVCGNSNIVGFNTKKGCGYQFQNTTRLWRTPADFELDLTQTLNEAYIKSLQVAGNLSILEGISDFPENGTDPLIETLPDNTEISAGDAKYKFSPVFGTSDMYFNKLLGSLEGQGNNRFFFLDTAGNILGTAGSDSTKVRGFLTSRTARGKYTAQSSGVGQKAMLDIQLANTDEYEDNWAMFFNENLPFDPRLIEPVVQAELSFSAVPSDTDTTITVNAKLARGLSSYITGADSTDNYEVQVNGTATTVSNVVEASNVYTLTIPAVATDDIVTVSFNGVIEISGDGLYRSYTETTTVVA